MNHRNLGRLEDKKHIYYPKSVTPGYAPPNLLYPGKTGSKIVWWKQFPILFSPEHLPQNLSFCSVSVEEECIKVNGERTLARVD